MNKSMTKKGVGGAGDYSDLEVYQITYRAMLDIHKYLLPNLPTEEKEDLHDRLANISKNVPRLVAEAYSKRNQNSSYDKHLEDAMSECHEAIVLLNQAKDLYAFLVDTALCARLIDSYNQASRQCYGLSLEWGKLKAKKQARQGSAKQSRKRKQK